VLVVPNAVDLTAWLPLPPRPADGPLRVLSVMRLTGVKRALPLLEVLRAASGQVDLRATVIGDGPKRAAMQRYVERHGLGGVVELAGTRPRHAIRERLAGAAVFLAPAHRESFGIAALEARASGVPVLASARSGVASFVTHGRDGLLAGDDLEMAAGLVRLLTDDRLRTRIADHNRLVPPPFGWDEALAEQDRVYALAGAVDRLGARTAVAR
jgi:glycosyltransferase involved in cell wall biosynthesis